MKREEVRAIVTEVLTRYSHMPDPGSIPVEASARHVHLSASALESLFGPGAELEKVRELSQPGEFLSNKRVSVVTPGGQLRNVAVLGPVRSQVQVELSLTDARMLGIDIPIRLSGDLVGASDVWLMGPGGVVEAKGSAIAALAHLHLTPEAARYHGVTDGETVAVRIKGIRPLTLEKVAVRVNENFATALHIDYDEANACGLEPGCLCTIAGRSAGNG